MEAPISKEHFIDLIENIVKFMKDQEDFSESLAKYIESCYGFNIGNNLCESLINYLQEILLDESDWLSYWLYECDCGKNEEFVNSVKDLDGSPISIGTVEELYDFLCLNYKESVGNNIDICADGKIKKNIINSLCEFTKLPIKYTYIQIFNVPYRTIEVIKFNDIINIINSSSSINFILEELEEVFVINDSSIKSVHDIYKEFKGYNNDD